MMPIKFNFEIKIQKEIIQKIKISTQKCKNQQLNSINFKKCDFNKKDLERFTTLAIVK